MEQKRYYIIGSEEEMVSLWKTVRRKMKDMSKENDLFAFTIFSDVVTFKQDMTLHKYCCNKKGSLEKEHISSGTKAIMIEGEKRRLWGFLQILLQEEGLSEQMYAASGDSFDHNIFSSSFQTFREHSPHEIFENEYIHAEPRFFCVI